MSLRSSPFVARLTVVLAAGGVLAFLALRASSFIHTLPWVPRPIGLWADANGIVRNTAAFLGFGLLAFALLGHARRTVVGLSAFASVIEVAQIWIPTRSFDPLDIAASLAGLALAWLLVRAAAWLLARP